MNEPATKEAPVAQREALLVDTFVTLADTMVTDFDVVEFLSLLTDRCVELFEAAAAGLMLADPDGHLQLIASSSHQMRLLELLELQDNDGPCPDSYRTGRPVHCDELRDATDRWPTFAPAALDAGFRSAHALPMRLRDDVIGALNLISTAPGPMASEDLAAVQALADVATIGILQNQATSESQIFTDQLQYALESRVVIEQAKGVIAHALNIDPVQAFDRLRRYSRAHNTRLTDIAQAIVTKVLTVDALTSPGTQDSRPQRAARSTKRLDEPGDLSVVAHRDGDTCVLVVEGEIDLASADRLADAIWAPSNEVVPFTVVDLSRCGFLDSAGVRALTSALRQLEAAGSAVRLVVAPSGSVRRILEITAIIDQFPFTVDAL